jgi:hypothetical protein
VPWGCRRSKEGDDSGGAERGFKTASHWPFRSAAVDDLTAPVSDSPTQAQVQADDDERITALQGTIEDMQRNLAMISDVLAMKPTVAEVEAALVRKKGLSPK